jgi:hypothetical protein
VPAALSYFLPSLDKGRHILAFARYRRITHSYLAFVGELNKPGVATIDVHMSDGLFCSGAEEFCAAHLTTAS